MMSTVPISRSLAAVLAFLGLSVVVCLTTYSQPAAAPARWQSTQANEDVNLTATLANLNESANGASIRLTRWSSAEERGALVAAMDPPPPPPPEPAEGRGGRRGGGGRGGRGGGAPDPEDSPDPMVRMSAALAATPTIGFIWTGDSPTGSSIKYAYQVSRPEGGERIVLATNRRIDPNTMAWSPVASGTAKDPWFTFFEIRLDSDGSGEGRASSLIPAVDSDAGALVLDQYATMPALLQNVSRAN